MMRKLSIALATTALLSIAAPAFAASVTGMTDTLTASPTHYVGHCPGVITFHGTVTVTGVIGPNDPVQIGYQFTRSDGATGPLQYFTITHPGTFPVSTTWTLGGIPALPHYVGWEKFKAWPTRHDGGFGYSFSPQARFVLDCREAATHP